MGAGGDLEEDQRLVLMAQLVNTEIDIRREVVVKPVLHFLVADLAEGDGTRYLRSACFRR